MLCIPRAVILVLVGISINPTSTNKLQLLAVLPFVPVSWDLKLRLGRVSVIPVLFRFLISSASHAGK